MMLAPSGEIAIEIDALAIRPGLGIQVLDLRHRRIADYTAIGRAKNDAVYRRQIGGRRQELFQDQFALTLNNRVRAGAQIFFGIVRHVVISREVKLLMKTS